jgi:hypothetical protein
VIGGVCDEELHCGSRGGGFHRELKPAGDVWVACRGGQVGGDEG